MNDFDDLVSRSLADRAGRAEPPTPDLTGLQRDMKRHLAKRRGVAAGGAVILVAGLGTVLALRSPARPPAAADSPATTLAASPLPAESLACPAGQVLTVQGDVMLHGKQPWVLAGGQCVAATAAPAVAAVATNPLGKCVVTTTSGEVVAIEPVVTAAPSPTTVPALGPTVPCMPPDCAALGSSVTGVIVSGSASIGPDVPVPPSPPSLPAPGSPILVKNALSLSCGARPVNGPKIGPLPADATTTTAG